MSEFAEFSKDGMNMTVDDLMRFFASKQNETLSAEAAADIISRYGMNSD